MTQAGLNPFCGGTLGVAVAGKAQQGERSQPWSTGHSNPYSRSQE
jgi:hypothetical protein